MIIKNVREKLNYDVIGKHKEYITEYVDNSKLVDRMRIGLDDLIWDNVRTNVRNYMRSIFLHKEFFTSIESSYDRFHAET